MGEEKNAIVVMSYGVDSN
jgi:hypothetical protein